MLSWINLGSLWLWLVHDISFKLEETETCLLFYLLFFWNQWWNYMTISSGTCGHIFLSRKCSLGSIFGFWVRYFLKWNAGQPKRHLLTSGWSLFVNAKKLVAGDSCIFVRYLLSVSMSPFSLLPTISVCCYSRGTLVRITSSFLFF